MTNVDKRRSSLTVNRALRLGATQQQLPESIHSGETTTVRTGIVIPRQSWHADLALNDSLGTPDAPHQRHGT